MSNCNSILECAGEWFVRSGIQEPDGGVARYYRSDLAKNALVSTEITGYAVSFLVYAFEQTGSAEFLEAAGRAARFLTRHAWDADLGVFPFEHSSNGSRPDALAYFFDSGIIARGLLAIWRVTREPEFLDTAVATGRGMLQYFQSTSGIHPILTLPDRKPRTCEPRWSASPGCYQLKSALAWNDLFEATGEVEFRSAYQGALEQAIQTHQAFLPGEPDSAKVMDRLHAYLYFLEGILPCAQRPDCTRAVRWGSDTVSGFIAQIAPLFERSDVQAQWLRVRLFADYLDLQPLHRAQADAAAAAILKFQFHSEDPRSHGGFGFGTLRGEMMPFVNPVSTAFCAQTLEMWRQHQAGVFHPDHLALV